MTTYSIRCRDSACRHRRVSKTHPDDYKRMPPCSVCGARKGWRIEQRTYNKKDLCGCGKVPLFPHRKGKHPCCDHHPMGAWNQAKRAGVPDDDIPIEHMARPCGADEPCPF